MPFGICTGGSKRRCGIRPQRVTLQKPTLPTDGETTPTFSDVADVLCEITGAAQQGNEQRRGDNIEAIGVYFIKLRYRSDIDPTWRIKWGSKYLNILDLFDEDGRKRYLVGRSKELRA